MNMKWLGLCGSLRAQSSNRAMLEAYRRVVPECATFEIYSGLASVPHFNPDDDAEPVEERVAAFRRQVRESDALIISTPEYAHGLPGSFKNALDWLVSEPDFPGKLVVTVAADRGSRWAVDSLHEVLRTMSAVLLVDACLSLPLGTNRLSADDVLARPDVAAALRSSAARLLHACSRQPA